jgi:hypothetical protein
MDELPEIDAIVGTTAFDKIVDVIDGVLAGQKENALDDINRLCRPDTDRIISTGGYYSYLKIAEGCDKRCTYCSIPMIRGNFRSVPMEELFEEAEYLAGKGVKELILVAQETTLYGKDLYGEKKLPELLKRLCEVKGIEWIRLLYCYPEEITDELIRYQKTALKLPDRNNFSEIFNYNWHDYFKGIIADCFIPLEEKRNTVSVNNKSVPHNWKDWALESVWFNKNGITFNPVVEVKYF